MRPRGHAVLGGTFDHFHAGHAALLASAFRVGRTVSIGVTTDRYLALHPKPHARAVQPYPVRVRALRRWLAGRFARDRYRTVPLEDGFGRSVESGVDWLVVSVETVRGGRAVNAERRRLGRPPVPLVVVPLVLADDLAPVSARRIRAGAIGPDGRRRAPLRVRVHVESGNDAAPARTAVRRAFPRARVSVSVVPIRPGAGRSSRRAGALARTAARGRDLGVGVTRRPGGGWSVAEASGTVALAPASIAAGTPRRLAAALVRLLAPSMGRKAFPL